MFALRKKQFISEDLAFQAWIKSENQSGMFTPDIQRLQMKKNHHVFVYNEAQEGFPKHYELVGNSQYLGKAYTVRRNFVMWKKALGTESFPFVLQGVPNIQPGYSRVKGELYSMSPEQVIKLDEHVLNTVQFDRVRLRAMIPHIKRRVDGSETRSLGGPIECWFYLGRKDFWVDLLDGGYQYPTVKPRGFNRVFEALSNPFHYTLEEHNDFKVSRKETVS